MQASRDALCSVRCLAGKLLIGLISPILATGLSDLRVLQVQQLLRWGDRFHDHRDLPRDHCGHGHPDALREKERPHPHARKILYSKLGMLSITI